MDHHGVIMDHQGLSGDLHGPSGIIGGSSFDHQRFSGIFMELSWISWSHRDPHGASGTIMESGVIRGTSGILMALCDDHRI